MIDENDLYTIDDEETKTKYFFLCFVILWFSVCFNFVKRKFWVCKKIKFKL